MVPTPRHRFPTNRSTSDLINEIVDFSDFAYAVEAAANNRAKMSVAEWVEANVHVPNDLQPYQRSAGDALNDPNPTYVISRMEIDVRPSRRDAMTVTVNMNTSPEPTETEMLALIEKLKAGPVARNWLATQKLAQAMGFDPIGDHVRAHRPRGRHATLDDAGDPDGSWRGHEHD